MPVQQNPNLVDPEFQKLSTDGHIGRDTINKQLIAVEQTLNTDVNSVDLRLKSLQSYLNDLNGQVLYLRSVVAGEKDTTKRANLYKVINTSLELSASFEGLILKALEVKHKIRQEFINSIHRKIKLLEIDLETVDNVGELNKVGLVRMVNLLQNSFDKFAESNNKEMLEVSNDVNSDEISEKESSDILTDEQKEMRKIISGLDTNPTYDLR